MQEYIVTEEDMKRYDILKEVEKKGLKLKEASNLLGLCYRQTIRIYKKYLASGLEGLIKRYNNKDKRRKVYELTYHKITDLYAKRYYDFNIMHFRDKLEEEHSIKLCYETVRKVLIIAKIHTSKKRRRIYRRRRRMPKSGLLIQMDSSIHQWIPNRDKWWLIAAIDDASNIVPDAIFTRSDTTYTNMSLIRSIIEKKGLFEALYVDKASHFKTTRRGGLRQEIDDEQDETQIQRILSELGITLIPANSPQAKGRIERLFGFFQDRLIKEMRLAKIKSYKDANLFLHNKFLPWYNKKYTHKVESCFKTLPQNMNLDLIFTIKLSRKVNKDNTITVNGQVIQLPPKRKALSYMKSRVEVRVREDRLAFILYKNDIIMTTKLFRPVREDSLLRKEKYISKRIIA